MFKTQLLTPLLAVATFLGMSGINTANASIISDRQTMVEMGKQFIKNGVSPHWEDFDWADANMVSPAKDNPYRYGAPYNRFTGALMTVGTTLGSLTYDVLKLDPKRSKEKNFTFTGEKFVFYTPQAATLIINYVANTFFANGDYKDQYCMLKRKIWFVKVNGQWKIKNYYTIMTKVKNTETHRWVKVNNKSVPTYNNFSDKAGTEFPF